MGTPPSACAFLLSTCPSKRCKGRDLHRQRPGTGCAFRAAYRMAYTEDCPNCRTQGSVSSHTASRTCSGAVRLGRVASRQRSPGSPVCPGNSECPRSRCRRPRPPRRRRGTRASCELGATTRCRRIRCKGAVSVRISACFVFRTYMSMDAVFRPVVKKRSAVEAELFDPGQVHDCLEVVHLRCCRRVVNSTDPSPQ